MERDDRDLLELLATDVGSHFTRVVELHQHQLYTFAYRLTGSAQDAEDIAQEAFVRAYVALVTYPTPRIRELKLRPWLYRITLNEFHHHARRARLHVIALDDSDSSPALDIEDIASERPDRIIESREQLHELEAALARLPERYRIPVLCSYFERLSYQEIADLLEQPVGTVKSSVFRGVRLLRTLMTAREQDAQQRRGKEDDRWNVKISNAR